MTGATEASFAQTTLAAPPHRCSTLMEQQTSTGCRLLHLLQSMRSLRWHLHRDVRHHMAQQACDDNSVLCSALNNEPKLPPACHPAGLESLTLWTRSSTRPLSSRKS